MIECVIKAGQTTANCPQQADFELLTDYGIAAAQADLTTPANSKLVFALDPFAHDEASTWEWIESWIDTLMGPRPAATAPGAPLTPPGGFDPATATALGESIGRTLGESIHLPSASAQRHQQAGDATARRRLDVRRGNYDEYFLAALRGFSGVV